MKNHGWWIIDMYSNLPREEQKQVKTEVEEGMRKIVLSTNICESSLTVPDVKYGKLDWN
jgi:HrpA-like RNA helicase